mgnify:CR=1 FL=1
MKGKSVVAIYYEENPLLQFFKRGIHCLHFIMSANPLFAFYYEQESIMPFYITLYFLGFSVFLIDLAKLSDVPSENLRF